MYTIIYFSPTGNTKYLAKKLSTVVNADECIALEQIKEIKPNDKLILMSSIHGFNVPRTVVRFIKNLEPNLFNEVHIINVGCAESWVNEAASIKVINILKKKGYSVKSNQVLAMPLTLIVPFSEEIIQRSIEASLQKINDFEDEITKPIQIPFKSKAINLVGRLEDGAARMFGLELHAKKNCTSCGICWNRCPEHNIKEKNGKPKFGFKCMMCLRCIYECPEQSITPYISKFMTHKKPYSINNHVKEEL